MLMQIDCDKWGIDKFSIEIIETLKDSKNIKRKEDRYIRKLYTKDHLIGYNIADANFGDA